MIDTVVLQFKQGEFVLKDNSFFDAGRRNEGRGYCSITSYVKDYRDKMRKQGKYFPEVKLPSRKNQKNKLVQVLEVQVSLPKMLYGTNLYEVDALDLELIYKRLSESLAMVGIVATREQIKKISVVRADMCKVIKLPPYLGSAYEVVKRLERFDYRQKSEYRTREYNDGKDGMYMSFYNSTQKYVVYDKFGEIVNNAQTEFEQEIKYKFEKLNLQKRNAIKFEISLQRKQSFQALIRRRKGWKQSKDVTLCDLMDKEMVRDILLDAFDQVFSQFAVCLISLEQMEENKLLTYLSDKGLKKNTRYKLFYYVRLARKFGLSGMYRQIGIDYSGSSIIRVKEEIALVLEELGDIDGIIPNLVDFLREEHEKFEVIKPKSS